MGIRPVTANQADCVRKIANDKHVGRDKFQCALDNGSFARFLDGLKLGLGGLVVPPPGASLHVIRACVNHGLPWKEAVNAAGSHKPNDYDVYKVEDLYPPISKEEIENDYVLLQFSNGDGSWGKALAWAQSVGLKPTVPQEVFAIGGQNPNLLWTFGTKLTLMRVVATTDCTFDGGAQACCVWWNHLCSHADLYWTSHFHHNHDWFAFRKVGFSGL